MEENFFLIFFFFFLKILVSSLYFPSQSRMAFVYPGYLPDSNLVPVDVDPNVLHPHGIIEPSAQLLAYRTDVLKIPTAGSDRVTWQREAEPAAGVWLVRKDPALVSQFYFFLL